MTAQSNHRPASTVEPLRMRWNSLAGWYVSGVSGLPRYEEQPGPVEYVRADAHHKAIDALAEAYGYLVHDERDEALVWIEQALIGAGVDPATYRGQS